MATFPTGVAIVTTWERSGQPRGMTCSSLCSVTLSPPTILVCLRSASPVLAAARRRRTFAVNLLSHDRQSTAELFASGHPARFDHVSWHDGAASGGPQLLDDAHAILNCQLTTTELVGDHAVVLGEVFSLWQSTRSCTPLLYGLRRYAAWPGWA